MRECCERDLPKLVKVDLNSMACYCFQKSQRELLDAVKNQEESDFLGDIKSKMKDPGCFCETANPSGKCCLVDVKGLISLFKEKLSK